MNFSRRLLLPLATIPFVFLAIRPLRSLQQAAPTPTLQGDPAHPAEATHWLETKLYFAVSGNTATHTSVPDAAWQDFLDREITPRFPAGLSVIDVYGQWEGTGQATPSRQRSKLLIIDYPNTRENAAKVDAIRSAWKQRTHEHSVLKVTEPVDVSF